MLCQDGAMLLSTLKKDFDAANVRLVAVGCSREDALNFVTSGHFKGDVYLDESKVIHKAFGCRVETWLGFVKPRVWLSFVQAIAKGLTFKKTEGDYKQLGGTFVIDTGNPEAPFLFEHRQNRWGDHPSVYEVRRAALRQTSVAMKHYSADEWILRKMRLGISKNKQKSSIYNVSTLMSVLAVIIAVQIYHILSTI